MNSKAKSPASKLIKLLISEKKEITSIYFYAILSGLLQLSVPLGVQAIIGFVNGATMVSSIYVLIFVVVFSVFLVGAMQVNVMRIIEKIQQKIFTNNAFEFAEIIPNIDLKKADGYYLPEKVNRFFDTLTIQKGLMKLLLDIPIASIQILFGMLLLSLYHPSFIVFSILICLILYFILKITSKRGLATSLEESRFKYGVASWLQEMAAVVKAFKFSQGTNFNLLKTDKLVLRHIQARTKHFRVLEFQFQTLIAFKVLITAAMLIIGTILLLDQKLNIGEFIAAEIIILMVISAIEKLIANLDSVYDVVTGLEKLSTVTELPYERDGNIIYPFSNTGRKIETLNLRLSYENEKNILSDLNVLVPSNTIVRIKGNLGSGKSTLLRVIAGVYTDFSGEMLINNIPESNYSIASLRAKTGLFLNQQELFSGTLLENISLGRTHITAQKTIDLSEKIGMSNFLANFPHGFETNIEPLGKKLPASIAKKILLLRALSGEPDLLVLEDPWIGSDDSFKKNMINYLVSLKQKATIIISSNDPDFSKICDMEIDLNKNQKLSTIEKGI